MTMEELERKLPLTWTDHYGYTFTLSLATQEERDEDETLWLILTTEVHGRKSQLTHLSTDGIGMMLMALLPS